VDVESENLLTTHKSLVAKVIEYFKLKGGRKRVIIENTNNHNAK